MSTPRHPRHRRIGRRRIEAEAAASSTIRGCTCDHEIQVRHEHGIAVAEIRHDDDCPVMEDTP